MGTSEASEPLNFFKIVIFQIRERSGSVVVFDSRPRGPVRALLASLRCVLEQDIFILA